MTNTKECIPPTLQEIRSCAKRIAPYTRRTPVFHWSGDTVASRLGQSTEVHLKLELLQRTGTFKARGAVNNALAIPEKDRIKGITTISAGNHAIAAAYAARCIGASAKVVMQASANPARVAAAKSLGAEVIMAEDGVIGFAMVEEIVKEEGRTFIHPFEGKNVTEATATCGLELHEAIANLDAVVIPVGAGGLCSGVGTITKLLNPACKVYAVEPAGAAIMKTSLDAGSAQHISGFTTIADSLAPPMTTPYCFSMCQAAIDELVLVSEDELAAACALIFEHLKFAVEPACAATTAAAFGPLREKLAGKKVALILCGSNIDADGFHQILKHGESALQNNILSI
ncbi:MAG: threonine dehydratase [Planctomycetota bacterium]